jgi:hypothetical protein
MSRSRFFEVRWNTIHGAEKGALAVELPGSAAGEKVSALTRAARLVDLPEGTHLHLETPESPSPDAICGAWDVDYTWADGTLNSSRFQRHLALAVRGVTLHVFRVNQMVASGPDLVGRQEDIRALKRILGSKSCHLRAPRRFGKTSLLLRLHEELPKSLRAHLGEVETLDGLVSAIIRGIYSTYSVFGEHEFPKELVKLPPAGSSPDAIDGAIHGLLKGHQGRIMNLLSRILEWLSSADIVMLLDEFSLFIRNLLKTNPDQARRLLGVMAEMRKRENDPLRCVVAGSAGLSSYMKFRGLDEELKDLEPYDVKPLADNHAHMLVEELFYGAQRRPNPETITRFLEHTGKPVPFFLHSLAHQALEEIKDRRVVSVLDIDRAYNERLLGTAGYDHFKPFRLDDRPYPDELRKAAKTVLSLLSNTREPVPHSLIEDVVLRKHTNMDGSDLESLMTCLEEDYDLERSDNGWNIGCKVLADRMRRLYVPPLSGK